MIADAENEQEQIQKNNREDTFISLDEQKEKDEITTTSSRTVSKEGQHTSKEEDNNNTIVSTKLFFSPSYNDSPIKLVSECENKINKENSNILTTQSSWSSLVPSLSPPS